MAGGQGRPGRLKALLNSHLSPRVAELLRAAGLDVIAIVEREDLPDDLPDAQVLEVASAEGRAVVTNNVKDFRPIAARRLQRGDGHAGLILIPSTMPRNLAATGRLADALRQLMLDTQDGITNGERWLTDHAAT